MHKLGKFLRLLASDKPGEVVAAAGAIVRTLQAGGHDIHALADVVERSPLAPQKETQSRQDKSSDWRTTRTWCEVISTDGVKAKVAALHERALREVRR